MIGINFKIVKSITTITTLHRRLLRVPQFSPTPVKKNQKSLVQELYILHTKFKKQKIFLFDNINNK